MMLKIDQCIEVGKKSCEIEFHEVMINCEGTKYFAQEHLLFTVESKHKRLFTTLQPREQCSA